MNDAKPVTVTLDKERTITYNNRAEYRMGSLDRPFEVNDLRKGRKRWAALVAWTWACLVEKDTLDFPSPEDLAPHMETQETITKAFEAFIISFNAAQSTEAKNSQG